MFAQVPRARSAWMNELIATFGFVQRNYFLTKRYFLWELVWLGYTTINAMSSRSSVARGAAALRMLHLVTGSSSMP